MTLTALLRVNAMMLTHFAAHLSRHRRAEARNLWLKALSSVWTPSSHQQFIRSSSLSSQKTIHPLLTTTASKEAPHDDPLSAILTVDSATDKSKENGPHATDSRWSQHRRHTIEDSESARPCPHQHSLLLTSSTFRNPTGIAEDDACTSPLNIHLSRTSDLRRFQQRDRRRGQSSRGLYKRGVRIAPAPAFLQRSMPSRYDSSSSTTTWLAGIVTRMSFPRRSRLWPTELPANVDIIFIYGEKVHAFPCSRTKVWRYVDMETVEEVQGVRRSIKKRLEACLGGFLERVFVLYKSEAHGSG